MNKEGFPTIEADVATQPKPNGRPSIRTKEIEEAVLAGIRRGESLNTVCDDPSFPHRDTVFDWLAKDAARKAAKEVNEGEVLFLDRYNVATTIRTDAMQEQILQIADDGKNDSYRDANGKVVVDHDNVRRAALRIDTRKWLMSRMNPKKYGDRPTETHVSTTVNSGFVMTIERQRELQERCRRALERT